MRRGWRCPRGEILACVWGGRPGFGCLRAQVELCIAQYFLPEYQAWNLYAQLTAGFQVAPLGLDAEPEGQVMGCPFKLEAACVPWRSGGWDGRRVGME